MYYLLSKKLLHIGKLYNKLIAKELPQIQSDYDVVILSVLYSNQDKLTQRELATILNVDKSRVVIMIYSLVQRQYIIVQKNPADRREHHISLSEKGLSIIPAIQFAIAEVNKVVNQQLDATSLLSFYSVLTQMESNLSAINCQAKFLQN